MTAAPQPVQLPRWTAGRIVALVFGIVLLLPGLGLLAGGGALLWLELANRSDGFVFSDTDSFTTDGYALASERIDLATGADWLPISATLGTARAEVTLQTGGDVFVGIAPADEGAAYLDGVQRSVIDDLGTTANDERAVDGGPPAGPPGDQDFWVAQASGPGTQVLDWEPGQGDWLFVVMNTDASAGVAMDARIGATFPALSGLAWGLLGAGLLLTAVAILLLVIATRSRAGRHTAPPPVSPWKPPVPVDRTTAADAQRDPTRTNQPPPSG
jgi:hypothetical protein